MDHKTDNSFPMPTPFSQGAYYEDGVDVSLIRWMLSLSLEERLQTLQDHVHSIQMMRRELTIT